MSFAKRLKDLMTEMEMSQAELSLKTGIGKSSISQYLAGKNIPREEVKIKIAEALGCTVDCLNEDVEDKGCVSEGLRRMTIGMVAKELGVSPQCVRVGIINNRFDPPIGTAVKMSSKWTYIIPRKRFENYIMECED